MQEKPKWLETAPQTPLHEKLHVKYYQHHIFCNGSRRHAIGTKGMGGICLHFLKNPDSIK